MHVIVYDIPSKDLIILTLKKHFINMPSDISLWLIYLKMSR